MNEQYFERAKAAYRAGDFSAAASMFLAAKEPNELAGEADHLRGNSLMKLGLYPDAAQAYTDALEDNRYGKAGALLTNRGKALAAAGDLEGAVDSFSAATPAAWARWDTPQGWPIRDIRSSSSRSPHKA